MPKVGMTLDLLNLKEFVKPGLIPAHKRDSLDSVEKLQLAISKRMMHQ